MEYCVGIFSGILIGVVTGIIPGIHINTVVAIVLASGVGLSNIGVDYPMMLSFVCTIAITHTFFDVLPGLFIGIPGSDAFSLLPGHRLVKNGEGQLAVYMSALASLFGLILCIVIVLIVELITYSLNIKLIANIESFFTQFMFYILLGISFVLIFSDKDKLLSAIVFLLSGAFGIAVLSSPIIPGGTDASVNVLLPSLAGLFGVAGLIYALMTNDPVQTKLVHKPFKKDSLTTAIIPSIRGGIAGLIVGLLPGLGAANAATLLLLIEQQKKTNSNNRSTQSQKDKSYLMTTSALNTAEAFFAIVALYYIGKTRSGASIAVDQVMGGELTLTTVFLIGWIMLIAGVCAFGMLLLIGKPLADFMGVLHANALHCSVLLFLVVFVALLLGAGGLFILVVASFVGLVPLYFGVRRAQLMGFFLLPVILFFSGHQAALTNFLAINVKNLSSNTLLPSQSLIMYTVIAITCALLIYHLIKNLPRNMVNTSSVAVFGTLITFISIVWLFYTHPLTTNSKPTIHSQQKTNFIGRVTDVIDGDTIIVSTFAKRYKLRLAFIDAPEIAQIHGQESKNWLSDQILNQSVSWTTEGIGYYGRYLAIIKVDGNDINQQLVTQGHAWAYRNNTTYLTFENQAKQAKLGLWQYSNPLPPWVFRK